MGISTSTSPDRDKDPSQSTPGDNTRDFSRDVRPLKSSWARWLLIGLGTLFVALGALGAVLPLLPTTPFMLLAAACYARASTRFYNWLLNNRLFGPSIETWRRDRTIPRKAKRTAIVLIIITFAITVGFFVTAPLARALLVLLAGGIVLFLLRLPTSEYNPN